MGEWADARRKGTRTYVTDKDDTWAGERAVSDREGGPKAQSKNEELVGRPSTGDDLPSSDPWLLMIGTQLAEAE